jgi:hypothetical protein
MAALPIAHPVPMAALPIAHPVPMAALPIAHLVQILISRWVEQTWYEL